MRSGDIAPVRSLLDALVEAEKLDQDEREEEVDRLLALARALPRAGIVEAVTRAAAGSMRRRRAGLDVLCQHADAPEVQATFVEWLRVPDATARFALIQTIGLRRLAGLAAELGRVIEGDPDELCRDMALWAAGQLRAPECLPVVLRLAAATRHQRPGTARLGATNPDWRLLQVLTAYGAPEGRPFLEVAFSDVVRKPGDRVQAAWGSGEARRRSGVQLPARDARRSRRAHLALVHPRPIVARSASHRRRPRVAARRGASRGRRGEAPAQGRYRALISVSASNREKCSSDA